MRALRQTPYQRPKHFPVTVEETTIRRTSQPMHGSSSLSCSR